MTTQPTSATAAATAAASYELNPTELQEALTLMVDIQQPTFVWVPPGIGKSDIARQVAAALGMKHHDIRAPLYDPVDLRGLPYMDKDPETGVAGTQWAPPTFLPPTESTERHLIVFDELPTAPPMVQNALYQLILDRRCGEYELAPGVTMIACGNRETDRGATYSMPTPLASRFIQRHLVPSLEQWQYWAARNDIAPEISFFLRFNPNLFHAFAPPAEKGSGLSLPPHLGLRQQGHQRKERPAAQHRTQHLRRSHRPGCRRRVQRLHGTLPGAAGSPEHFRGPGKRRHSGENRCPDRPGRGPVPLRERCHLSGADDLCEPSAQL